jgi:hypothetical protein
MPASLQRTRSQHVALLPVVMLLLQRHAKKHNVVKSDK